MNRRERRAIQTTQRRLKRKAQREMLRLMRMMDENPELAALVAEELDSHSPTPSSAETMTLPLHRRSEEGEKHVYPIFLKDQAHP